MSRRSTTIARTIGAPRPRCVAEASREFLVQHPLGEVMRDERAAQPGQHWMSEHDDAPDRVADRFACRPRAGVRVWLSSERVMSF